MPTKLFYKGIEQKIVSNLSNTKNELKIAVAWLTNPILFNLILELANSGKSIELILCDDIMNFTNPKINFQYLIDLGINVRVSKSPHLMHNKFCIIDNRILINGSYNWTLRAEIFNYENIIISTDKELISDFENYFSELKEKTNRIIKIPNLTFQNYYSQEEMNLELELEQSDRQPPKIIKELESILYSDEINQAIDKAELLYRTAKHTECIEFCKDKIQIHPKIPEFHSITASAYWRTNKNKKLIDSALIAIEINNELWSAYNLLGIGYSRIVGKEQQSIKNYNICLTEFPYEHTFLRNRAISQINLERDVNIPKKFRDNYKEKADKDLQKIIQVVSKKNKKEQTYSELHSRALAYFFLGKTTLAFKDINWAIEKYNQITDNLKLDKNELLEMKKFKGDCKRFLSNKN